MNVCVCVYIYMIYLTTMFAAQDFQNQMVNWLMSDEVVMMWKKSHRIACGSTMPFSHG
jgi:hypothetical protein